MEIRDHIMLQMTANCFKQRITMITEKEFAGNGRK